VAAECAGEGEVDGARGEEWGEVCEGGGEEGEVEWVAGGVSRDVYGVYGGGRGVVCC